MNKYTPTEVKDLTASKQRVMQNVLTELENTRKPKHKWRYGMVTAVLLISAMLFVLNEIVIEHDQQSINELQLNATQPSIFEEQGLFYLQGVTIGDSQSKVIENLGENYTLEQEDGSGADFVMNYDDNRLDWILLKKVDTNYFDQLFKDYTGFKFITASSEVNNDRYFYSKETSQLLKATTQVPNEDLYLYLIRGGKDLLENPDFPKIEQVLD